VFRGDKVVLRAVERDDLEQLWRWRNDLDLWLLMEDAPPVPTSLAEYEAAYERRATDAAAAVDEWVRFAIEAGGRLVGECSMFDFDPLARSARIGVLIGDQRDRGKGLGRDAVRVLLDYGFRHRNLHRVELDVLATNEAALRVYRALGLVEEGRLRDHAWSGGRHVDTIVMAVLRPDWAQ
jgi:RimJ/RimL family protein N-acetyltransferase